jgi:N-acetylmuramic acid 6-phosphate etherase
MVQGIMAGGMTALYSATEASEDSREAGQREVEERGINGNDAVCGIAASGRTPYVLGAMAAARAKGALTLGISCTPDSELSRAVEYPIEPCPGPEVITGSTRLKAGTATKLVLNMLTTMSMVRLGYVWSNLMVNLKPANEKLVARAQRIISQAAGIPEAEAARLLRANQNNVRNAIEQAIKEKQNG